MMRCQSIVNLARVLTVRDTPFWRARLVSRQLRRITAQRVARIRVSADADAQHDRLQHKALKVRIDAEHWDCRYMHRYCRKCACLMQRGNTFAHEYYGHNGDHCGRDTEEELERQFDAPAGDEP